MRQINNTIDICSHLTYTYIEELRGKIQPDLFDECQAFIDKIREWRHKTELDRHLIKFERLCQKPKTRGGRSKQHQVAAQTTLVPRHKIETRKQEYYLQ